MKEWSEHEKLRAISEKSAVIGEFLEFSGFILCEFRKVAVGTNDCPHKFHGWGSRRVECEDGEFRWCYEGRLVFNAVKPSDDRWCVACKGTGSIDIYHERFVPVPDGIEKILARYFDIDLDKIEAEKRAMLAYIRETNSV